MLSNSLVNVKNLRGIAMVSASEYPSLQAAIDASFLLPLPFTVVVSESVTITSTLILRQGVNLMFINGAKINWAGPVTGRVVETDSTKVVRNVVISGDFRINVGNAFEGVAFYMHSAVGFWIEKLSFEMTTAGAGSVCLKMAGDSTGGEGGGWNRNCGNHFIGAINQEGVCGTLMETSGFTSAESPMVPPEVQAVTLNTFGHIFSYASQNYGIRLMSMSDSNTFSGMVRLNIIASNSIGIEFGADDTKQGVYNNVFTSASVDTFVISGVGNRTPCFFRAGVKQNKIVQLFNDPPAENALVVASPFCPSYDVGTADVTTTLLNYKRGLSFAGEGINFARTIIIEDDGWAAFNVAEGGINENLYLTIDTSGNDSNVCASLWLNPRRTSGPPQIAKLAGSSFVDVTTGPLNGTTGVDGKITYSAANDGKFYVENRLGFQIIFNYTAKTFMNGN
jgi:hypothetical protein